ncbi:acyltransferase domain-containing protein, partial [Streptomyces sp. NPDC004365]
DPIEAEALMAVFGAPERARPLLLGSVKSNIGHTQAAAGVAGVIKTVMALRAGLLPRSLHAERPTPDVDWTAGSVRLLTANTPWPHTDAPRRAGVSSFGISGTNAHVVLEQAADPVPSPSDDDTGAPASAERALPWVLSARTPAALRDQARLLLDRVTAEPRPAVADLAYALATGRALFEHRAALTATGHDDLMTGLAALTDPSGTADAPGVLRADAPRPGRVAFLFPGQGNQRLGMGRELYDTHPAFRAALDEVTGHFDPAVRDVMWGDDEAALDRTGMAQPALFAVEVALFRLLESWGVRAEFVAGHSVGEIAAAHVAGVLSLADAAALVAARGRLMAALPPGGVMVAVEASEDEIRPLLTPGVAVAAVNGPRALVLSGADADVERVLAPLGERRHTRLTVSHAFHSPLMDPALEPFRTAVAELSFAEPTLPVVSNVTGRIAEPGELTTPGYWVRHLRETVRFADGVRTLAEHGVGAWLEVGPGGALAALAQETLPPDVVVTPLLHGGPDEEHSAVTALARLYVHGVPVDFTALFAGTGAQRVALPTYPFRRSRFPFRHADRETEGTDLWSALRRTEPAALAGRLGVTEDAVRSVVPALLSWRSRHRSRAALDALRHREHWQPHTFPSPGGTTG